MKKSKRKWPQDRLSELPEPLIFHIFWFLPLKDVVRTTILSKYWKKLWTTSPCLNIEYLCDDINSDTDAIRNFVNRALVMWEGQNIDKFKINFGCADGDLFFPDFDFWVYFALEKKVKELNIFFDAESRSYRLPKYLLSCSWLKVLSLAGCMIEMNENENVHWNQLKCLKIDCHWITASGINQVLCGSPRLEVFALTLVDPDHMENWIIRSSSLKRLLIYHDSCEYGPWEDVEIRIWTPNLETLEISGIPFCNYLLMDVSSLTEVNLGFCGALRMYDAFSCESVFLKETLKQIIPAVQRVERVVLSEWCIQVLGYMNLKDLLPSSSIVKFLKLNNSSVHPQTIVRALKIFPKLEVLVLKGKDNRKNVWEPIQVNAYIRKSFLQHLKKIEITLTKDRDLLLQFLKLVLKFARKLEKMVVRGLPPAPPSDILLLASQELLRMPRSSPSAELILC